VDAASTNAFKGKLEKLRNNVWTVGCHKFSVSVVVCTVGQVGLVHTLPETAETGIVVAMTSLGEEIYVLRLSGGKEIEVYDVITYGLQRRLSLPFSRGYTDMTSCEHYRCMYISDPFAECVHRVNCEGHATRWGVYDNAHGLSVNSAHNLLVTCRRIPRIKELSPRGDLMREIRLPDTIINPWHAQQLTSGQFIVCHGEVYDAVRRVCLISEDGHYILHSHGGQRGSDTGQYGVPRHLAIDSNDFVLVADISNRRVTLLSPTLDYVRDVVTSKQLKSWFPYRISLDVRRRRLYVTENEFESARYKAGRVAVFSI